VESESVKPAPKREPAPRQKERDLMVKHQLVSAWDRREPVTNPRVLEAMRRVPRHAFVSEEWTGRAYDDTPLPIGHGQTISQPYIVGLMTELLQLAPGARVLEIGTGSGYQAAVLAELTEEVYSIEIVEPLAARVQGTLARAGYDEVKLRQGDGYFGWPEAAPFDAIIVTCAAGHLPPPLWEQLKPGGRIVIPIGDPYAVQRLVVVSKTLDGKRTSETVLAVQFVPMTRSD